MKISGYSYNIIESIDKTKYEKLFLVSCDINKNGENNLYILNKIEMKSNEEKKKLTEEIEKIKLIDSKYVIKIYDYFIEHEEEKELCCILIENCIKDNLEKLIEQFNYLNSRNIWKFFIQIILGLKSLHLNNINLKNLTPKNIFIDKEKNIKIGGFDNFLDFNNEDLLLKSYLSPEILKNEQYNNKSNIWSLGCILYELVLKKKPFENIHFDKIDYYLPDNCEDDLKKILSKLLCEEKNRLTIKEILIDPIFKQKIFEVNIFSEIVKDNIKSNS